ncbi:EAL domain-containing protein [Ureibacillus sp. MALMAid1270]|uniref:EAL domain-containing protein n=1 Tax=Ureibacillus sp. MALMAid1270 TaxID=3411629 RepID=UPI003BA7C74B
MKKEIEDREFTIYYQPRVDAKSNKIISEEALIRWNHPEWGIVSPAEFLSFAEENGLISEIDDWVFSDVCHQIKKWKDASIPVVQLIYPPCIF